MLALLNLECPMDTPVKISYEKDILLDFVGEVDQTDTLGEKVIILCPVDDLPTDYTELRRMGFGVWANLGHNTADSEKMRNAISRVLLRTIHSRSNLTAEEWKTWIRNCRKRLND